MSQSPDAASGTTTSSAGQARHAGTPLRLIVGIILGAGLALLGGWILGEYPFTGVMPYIAGVLFALVVAETIVSVSRRTYWVTAVAAAVSTVGGLGLGVWISTGRGIDPVPIGGVVAIVIGAVVALLRGGVRAGGRRAPSSQPSS
jgi:hypothetical protein